MNPITPVPVSAPGLNPIENYALNFVAGFLISKAMEFAKYSDSVKNISPENERLIQLLLNVAALLVAIGQNWLNGTLSTGVNWASAAQLLLNFAVTVVSWFVSYETGLSKNHQAAKQYEQQKQLPAAPPATK